MYLKDKELVFEVIDKNSPHSIVPTLVDFGSTVLDVGCNAGYLGSFLTKHKNCICDGIDVDKKLLDKARKSGYRNTSIVDLYYPKFKIREKYNCLLFIDILEHLPNPYVILEKFVKENLEDGGKVIISLPNIGRFELRLSHLFGRFDYEESRIMHQDHLRFFTRKTGVELIEESGLKIKAILPTGLGARIKILPTLTAFQFIYVCEKPRFTARKI